MATMNISLPEPMKRWVEAQGADGRFSNSSDYIRALIRREQVREAKIAHMRELVREAEESGLSDKTVDQIFNEALAEFNARKGAA